MGVMKFNTELSFRRIEQIQHLLRRNDCTVHEIADGVHMVKRWAVAYVTHLHKEKKIHISEWRRIARSNGSGYSIPVYCWGKAKDAKKPRPTTAAERSKKYRSTSDSYIEVRERECAKKRASRLVPVRDWTAAWIPTKEAA